MIDKKMVYHILDFIKEFNLKIETKWLKEQVERVVDEKEDFELASDLIEEFGLEGYKWIKKLVQMIINKKYFNDALAWIKRFDLEEEFGSEKIKELIKKLIKEKKDFYYALYWIMEFGLRKEFEKVDDEFDIKKMIEALIYKKKEFGEALYFIEHFSLFEDRDWLKEQVQKMVNKKIFNWVFYFIERFDLEEEFDIKKLLEMAIDEEYFDVAFKYIKIFGLDEDKEWLKEQIRKIYKMDEIWEARVWIREFDLEEELEDLL